MPFNRRQFIAGAAAATAAQFPATASAAPDAIPIIDCHIHLFDGTRPQGAPYHGSRAFPGGVALPKTYEQIARPLGIVGAIEVEASPWIEDNLWVLETIQPFPFMLGTVGNLQPDRPDFPATLERYAKNPLYRGIRYGNLWHYDLPGQVNNPAFIDGLKLLAAHDLALDTANQTIPLLQAAVAVNDKVPDLRIVLDHLPAFDPTPENQAAFEAVMREVSQRPNIWAKLSEIVHPARGPRPPGVPQPPLQHDLGAHRARLDMLMGYLGEDRVLFGSDWPNCVGVSEVPDTVALVRAYFAGRGRQAAEKYFWKNALAAYKWTKRAPDQPSDQP